MNAFLKENSALVIAVALPLLFAGFFLLTKTASTVNVEQPRYDFIIVKDHYNHTATYEIMNGRLQASFTYPSVVNAPISQKSQAYLISADTMIAEPINLALPADAFAPVEQNLGKRVNLPLPQFENVEFSAASISPDGFELDYNQSYDGNLMTEIFSAAHRRDYGMALVKDGKAFEIRGLKDNYGYEIVGWILSQSDQSE